MSEWIFCNNETVNLEVLSFNLKSVSLNMISDLFLYNCSTKISKINLIFERLQPLFYNVLALVWKVRCLINSELRHLESKVWHYSPRSELHLSQGRGWRERGVVPSQTFLVHVKNVLIPGSKFSWYFLSFVNKNII